MNIAIFKGQITITAKNQMDLNNAIKVANAMHKLTNGNVCIAEQSDGTNEYWLTLGYNSRYYTIDNIRSYYRKAKQSI